MKQGLLPICHEAIVLGDVSMYDYEGPLNTQDAKDKLARTLGPNNKVLILRNHGVLVGGESIEEAFHNAHNLTAACDTQVGHSWKSGSLSELMLYKLLYYTIISMA